MKMRTGIWSTGLFAAIILCSCIRQKKMVHADPEKRTYAVLMSRPVDAIALRPRHDSSVVFYFDRAEWYRMVPENDSNRTAVSIYRNLLDSLEKSDGEIHMAKLKWTVTETWHLNPGKTTQDIFDSLIGVGRVFIVYPDGKHVNRISTYASPGFAGETVYFNDAESGHVLYYIARSIPGQF